MRVALAAALLLGVALARPAFADEEHDACLSSGEADETRCGDEWITREQSRLDAVWQRLTGIADGDVAKALLAEQHAWQAFSDLSCIFKKDEGFGGAGGPTGYHACRAEVISSRAKALQGYIGYIDN